VRILTDVSIWDIDQGPHNLQLYICIILCNTSSFQYIMMFAVLKVIIVRHAYTCIYRYVYMYIYTYTHINMYTHTHTHTYIHTYIHTYMHTHIRTFKFNHTFSDDMKCFYFKSLIYIKVRYN